MENMHTIDANGKRLGRVATEIAHVVLGKESPRFAKNVLIPERVVVENASGILLDEKKIDQKSYVHYSGFPGGKKEVKLEKVLDDKGISEVLRRAVYGMLPANKLRSKRMKLISIHE